MKASLPMNWELAALTMTPHPGLAEGNAISSLKLGFEQPDTLTVEPATALFSRVCRSPSKRTRPHSLALLKLPFVMVG